MTKSECRDTLPYDPEIERTIRRLGKQVTINSAPETQSCAEPSPEEPSCAEPSSETSPTHHSTPEMAENVAQPAVHNQHALHEEIIHQNPAMRAPVPRERTMRELATPVGDQAPLCITYPPLTVRFELKTSLIHLLPKFRGLQNEKPHKHLKEFNIVCSSMRPQGSLKIMLN